MPFRHIAPAPLSKHTSYYKTRGGKKQRSRVTRLELRV
jgi:hypothetical protein